MIKSWGIIKGEWEIPYLVGLFISIIFAQLKIYELVVKSILDLLFKQENWWWRSIIIVIIFGIIATLHVISKLAEKKMKEKHKENVEKETEQKLKEVKGLTEGIRDVTK